MFNNKPYATVNREERNYCFLFAHALLMSNVIRSRFSALIEKKSGLVLEPNALEVYLEAAALRDYWFDLGDSVIYSAETHERRRTVLVAVLKKFGLDANILDQHDLFWTSPAKQKLWNPNHWNIEALKAAGLDKLKQVKWAFNAKPDLLLMTPESILVIEAKIESGEGCKADVEYRQFEIQKLITELWQLLIPQFQNRKLELTLLEVTPTRDTSISWADVIDLISGSEVDEFTRNALDSLKRYYPKTHVADL